MIIPVKTKDGGYDIILERGALKNAGEYLNLKRRVLIVTDSGVPKEYANSVAAECLEAEIFVFKKGEASKNFDTYKDILAALIKANFTRTDCVVAVGGGVVGDMAGFAAATFMRGIDFYNIPTTLLSQVDSSIGGKTAIDFCGYKNIVGAFYQPKRVIIDADTLSTLDKRQISNGMAEAVKMSLTHDSELFAIFEKGDAIKNIDTVIERSLKIKRSVVEADEQEAGLRKVLNFGHTVGHAIESNTPSLYHGECVALGMLPLCSEMVRARLINVLESLGLPTAVDTDYEEIIETMRHDKKMAGENISYITVTEVGSFNMEKSDFNTFAQMIKRV
ncbi:MAG: 3-dehydroquinate synthase [Oscillospiraceae bacterium]|nr:3-dehydroquinate synthase [Oscillospiraceae bacterium]